MSYLLLSCQYYSMCYEFMHVCNTVFIAQISKAVGPDSYFMVCIGQLNYLYANDNSTIDSLKAILRLSNIDMQVIHEEEMSRIVNFPGTCEIQLFYGSTSLFKRFKQAY